MGRLGVSFTGTRIMKFEQQNGKDSPFTDYVGKSLGGNAPVPKWQHTLAFDLTMGTWNVALENTFTQGWMESAAVVNTNLTGAFLCTQQAFRMMKEQVPMGGRIINNGSISAHAPRPGSIAYTATKHAISGLTRAANLDGRPFDIAVGQIDIGNVASDMTERMVKGVHQADGTIKPEARMDMSAVVDTFMTMARLPLSANILFTTVMATKMPFVGRG
jgi:NAD(P)-dependent dehydrogenase (short-subunit alcohol dehydrogenase family)